MLVAVLVLILLGAGGVGVVAYQSSRSIVQELWEDLSEQIAHGTSERALRFFESARPYVDLTRRVAERGELDVANDQELLDYFLAAVQANPEFTWASFGRADGSYIAVHRAHDGSGIEGHIRGRGQARTIPYNEERGWGEPVVRESDYDPRPRPWYQAALRSDDGCWVEPFVFATVNAPGFAYVRAQRDASGVRGVFAVEYDVSELSAYLRELKVGEHGRTYVLTHEGHVVGHPDGLTSREADGDVTIARAEGHPDRELADAFAALAGRTEARLTLDRDDGEDMLVLADPFPTHGKIDWMVVIVVPESDFFGHVEAQTRRTAWIAVLLALLALFVGTFFANRVSSALREMAEELDRVGRFDLADRSLPAAHGSSVREVHMMSDAVDRMKGSLRSFGKYVPVEVVRELVVSGDEAALGGKKAELSVLFSDIAGFTNVAEKMDPDRVVEILAEYLQVMSDAIRDTGGTVDKYIGDAIMAFWGAPHDDPDHASSAARGALAMQEALATLQARWDEEGLPNFDTRIGLNTGEMVVGNIGAPDRLNYTVMGDAVNLGARLEPLNKEYGTMTMIGEATVARWSEEARAELVVRRLDWVAVKGKETAILVYELVGTKETVSPALRAAIEKYERGLDLYRARAFEEGARAFEEASAVYAKVGRDDVASAKLGRRCRQYQDEPPGDRWNGSVAMTTK